MNKDNAHTEGSPETKKTDTAVKILTAAKMIFSEHPYHTASIRMVGDAAGLNYQLIIYYFSSKAQLFEAEAQQRPGGLRHEALAPVVPLEDPAQFAAAPAGLEMDPARADQLAGLL